MDEHCTKKAPIWFWDCITRSCILLLWFRNGFIIKRPTVALARIFYHRVVAFLHPEVFEHMCFFLVVTQFQKDGKNKFAGLRRQAAESASMSGLFWCRWLGVRCCQVVISRSVALVLKLFLYFTCCYGRQMWLEIFDG